MSHDMIRRIIEAQDVVERDPDVSSAPAPATPCSECGEPIMGGPNQDVPIQYSPQPIEYLKKAGTKPTCLKCLAKTSDVIRRIIDPDELEGMVPEPPPEWTGD